MFFDTLKMSFSSLRMNRLRTFLTTLGIVIGIASIIALMTIGEGVVNAVVKELSGLGGNNITVQLTNTTTVLGFSASDLEEFGAVEGVDGISPTISGNLICVVPYEEGVSKSVYSYDYVSQQRIVGISDYYYTSASSNDVIYGRTIQPSDLDNTTCVCVLGYNLWKSWYGNYIPVGEVIRINNVEMTIVGIASKLIGFSTSNNSSVLVPYTTAQSVLGMGLVRSFDAVVARGYNVKNVMDRLDNKCSQLLRTGKINMYRIIDQSSTLEVVDSVTELVLGLVAGVAAIALIVGGIGIMNMMLVSVTERTAEIGLRKALGARPGAIRLQFLMEAMLLSAMGGLIGVVAGLIIAFIASVYIGFSFAVSASTILLSVGFSVAVGLLFGLLPASKAAKLKPIDALRSA